ncbi:vanadium-dependent haloperoxidase [Actinomadura alba]|uniref:Vanadium-dependent haloperoxidase n=1 Tax=Actinomadura alba TaxID=406431 RepID=A0ABR7LV84_9ACTN|nr:vanadium-dependent haloperoxidase [Actinomadura alba]MBC6468417.1 vanadium-dependent haloperoxidase [Actinomadura alba]
MTPSKRSPVSEFSPRRRSLLLGGASTAALTTLGLGGTAAAGLAPRSPEKAAADFNWDTGNFIIDLVATYAPDMDVFAPMDPTVLHRFLHFGMVGWFDALAPYHPTAVGVHSRVPRRPSSERRTNRQRNIAGMHSSWQVIKGVEPDRMTNFRKLMESVGLNPDDESMDNTTPVGIGNLTGKAAVAAAVRDGMNQLGDMGRKYNGKPFEDYTGYRPVNSAYELSNPSRWQPRLGTHNRRLAGGAGDAGAFTIQCFLTPQMGRAKPYTFRDPKQFELAPPRHTDHTRPGDYKRSVDEILMASASLTDEQKAKAEFFDDKRQGIGASPVASIMAHGGLDLDGWTHFLLSNSVSLYDALIAAWHQKRAYDSVRPFSAVRHVYGRQEVRAWGGPGKGTVDDMPANEWAAYLNVGDHPEYPSGSTTMCSAEAQAARRYFGDDVLKLTHTLPAGGSLVEPKITPAREITLHWATWTEFLKDCGYSRVWGGVHFKQTVEASMAFGKQFGDLAHEFMQRHVKGDVD